jgi:hypothetical protein
MPNVYKQLGQNNPGTSATSIYTAPAAGSAVVSSIVICNTSAAAKTFRIHVCTTSATAAATTNAIAYDNAVPANETIVMTAGLTISGSFSIKTYASTTDVVFSVYGQEIT